MSYIPCRLNAALSLCVEAEGCNTCDNSATVMSDFLTLLHEAVPRNESLLLQTIALLCEFTIASFVILAYDDKNCNKSPQILVCTGDVLLRI